MIDVYNKEGINAESKEEIKKFFRYVKVGEIFKHRNRVLMRTNSFWIMDYSKNEPEMKKINAIRLYTSSGEQEYVGKYSAIAEDTTVELYPNAALYLKG